jgi:hypothetical protein
LNAIFSFPKTLLFKKNKKQKQKIKEMSLPPDMNDGMLPMTLEYAWHSQKKFQNKDVIWGKPKGILFTDMPGAGPEQKAFYYPDGASTYFVISMVLQRGYHLILKGSYPHARYFSYTIANSVGSEGDIGGGQFLRDHQIEPNPGSMNPYRPNVNRNYHKRNYTIHIVQANPETPFEFPNVLYVPDSEIGKRIHLSFRIYLVDEGYNVSGTRSGLPIASLKTSLDADANLVTGMELFDLLQIRKDGETPFPPKKWKDAVFASKDPVNAPARINTRAQVFCNTAYSVFGPFIEDELERVKRFPATHDAGFTSNPDTIYMLVPFSFGLGQVFMVQGRMPTFPKTKESSYLDLNAQVRYFSISTAGSPAYGVGWNTVYDEEIPLDSEGNYTIITSWPFNRPSNSVPSNGIIWLSPGNGEGNYIGSRNWVGVLYIRFQVPNPNWAESPAKVPLPTVEAPISQEESIMGPYYPRTQYISKVDFENLF